MKTDKAEKEYPFFFNKEIQSLMPGCEVCDEFDGAGFRHKYFIAHRLGKIHIELVSRVEMPGRYMDRIFYKKSYTYPCGEVRKSAELHVMTIRRFVRFLESPFPHYYDHEEIDEPEWLPKHMKLPVFE